ncbi:MAG: TIGR04283 family arsenosugar biosynthesis glycosyltransferase [Balneolaceae bacterium]
MISIIIPVLNEEKTIGRLIAHLKKRSTGYLTEIIVADGGSTDRTMEIAREEGATILECKNKGRGVQMNEGAVVANGDILYFLHADTFPPDGYDQRIVEAYNNGYKSGCFQLRFDDAHWTLKTYSWFTRFDTTWFRFGDQSLYVEKLLFDNVDGFDESLIVMEDQEIIRRLKKQTPFKVLAQYVITSSRKYKQNGYIKLQCLFALIWAGYYFGINQEVLTHFYKEMLADPSNQKI